LNSYSSGNSKKDDDYETGFGFGIGFIYKSIPIMPALTFNPEAHFLYRRLYSKSDSDENKREKIESEEYFSEFAIGVSALAQYAPIAGTPFYITAGLQIDMPFSSETKWEETTTDLQNDKTESESGSNKEKDRRTFDLGIALGAGYNVTERIRADFRIVIGLTSLTGKDKDESSFNQYGLGVAYFF
jgi:opacity protein-like surface antigen